MKRKLPPPPLQYSVPSSLLQRKLFLWRLCTYLSCCSFVLCSCEYSYNVFRLVSTACFCSGTALSLEVCGVARRIDCRTYDIQEIYSSTYRSDDDDIWGGGGNWGWRLAASYLVCWCWRIADVLPNKGGCGRGFRFHRNASAEAGPAHSIALACSSGELYM